MDWMAHLVPFHRSARLPESDPPTAMHADGDVQETALRNAPGSVGIAWLCHRVPFQRSDMAALPLLPTAMHTEGLGHATPDIWLEAAPLGFGVCWTCHPMPFHRSAMVSGVPEPWE